jgi:hypothetical protein
MLHLDFDSSISREDLLLVVEVTAEPALRIGRVVEVDGGGRRLHQRPAAPEQVRRQETPLHHILTNKQIAQHRHSKVKTNFNHSKQACRLSEKWSNEIYMNLHIFSTSICS